MLIVPHTVLGNRSVECHFCILHPFRFFIPVHIRAQLWLSTPHPTHSVQSLGKTATRMVSTFDVIRRFITEFSLLLDPTYIALRVYEGSLLEFP
jgi:hypothetical protein